MSDSLTERVIGCAIEVSRHLGPGLLECIYEEALSLELEMSEIEYQRQLCAQVFYKGRAIADQRLDLVIANEVIVEVKAQSKLHQKLVTTQILSYLRATGFKRALLIKFAEPRVIMESEDFLCDLCVLCG